MLGKAPSCLCCRQKEKEEEEEEGKGELPTACSCGQYGHRSRSGGGAGRVIGDESEGGFGLAGFQPATNLDPNLDMFHQSDSSSSSNSLWGESGLQLVSALLLTFSRLLNVGCPHAARHFSIRTNTFFKSDKYICQINQI